MAKFNFKHIGKWSALLLTILPFIGYCLAYSYEWAYVSYFNVPDFLIKANIEAIVKMTSFLFATLFAGFNIAALGIPLIKCWKKPDPAFVFATVSLLILIYIEFRNLVPNEILKIFCLCMVAGTITIYVTKGVMSGVRFIWKRIINVVRHDDEIRSKHRFPEYNFHRRELTKVLVVSPGYIRVAGRSALRPD